MSHPSEVDAEADTHSWIALGMSSAASQRKLTQNSGVHIPDAGHLFKVNLIQASAA